jgi:hypothetical protein
MLEYCAATEWATRVPSFKAVPVVGEEADVRRSCAGPELEDVSERGEGAEGNVAHTILYTPWYRGPRACALLRAPCTTV